MKNRKLLIIILSLIGLLIVTTLVYTVFTKPSNSKLKTKIKPKVAIPITSTQSKPNIAITSIRNKMLNSIDYYNSLKGTYKVIFSPINENETVSFSISRGKRPGSYAKIVDHDPNRTVIWKSDGNHIIELNEDQKTYQKFELQKINFNKSIQRISKDSKGNPLYVYRPDPLTDQMKDVAFPQAYAFWLQNNDKIVGHKKYLNRDVTVIEGNIPPSLVLKRKTTLFKMFVDSKTGVLLRLDERNTSDTMENSIVVTSIVFNTNNIDHSKFSTSIPVGFKNLLKQNS